MKNSSLDQYFSLVRTELFPLLPQKMEGVLEVGCGTGATLQVLKKQKRAKRVVGIEMDGDAARVARRVTDSLLVGDVETMNLPFKPQEFDAILFPDVLEHLRDPWSVLRKFHPFLKDSGVIVVSLPNIRHFSVLIDLVWHQRWQYTESGIMDRTHLRFFTRSTIVEALEQTGYQVQEIRTNGGQLTGWKHWLDILSGQRISPWFVAQHLILAQKKS